MLGFKNNPELVEGHFFVGFERRFVEHALKRQAVGRTAIVKKLEQNYGPEGMLFYNAGLVWSVGGVFGILGTVCLLLPFSGTSETLPIIGFAFLVVCFVTSLTGLFRALQANRAGRRFRAGRPFEKIGPIWQGEAPSR